MNLEKSLLGEVPDTDVVLRRDAQPVHGSHGVDVAGVAHQCVHELAVGEVPQLDRPIPGAGHEDQFVEVGAETDAADPLGVAVGTLNRALVLAERIPDLDGAVAPPSETIWRLSGEMVTERTSIV